MTFRLAVFNTELKIKFFVDNISELVRAVPVVIVR